MLLIGFGTRPEFLKIKPVVDELDRRNIINDKHYELVFTGQHNDVIDDYSEYEPIIRLSDDVDYMCENRLDHLVCNTLLQSSNLIYQMDLFEGVTHLLVQGDTTSAFAMALAAFHRKIPIIHLEAGMRTKNNHSPFPEELNRRAISVMADIHLCPTEKEKNNLLKEGINGDIHVVGNTVLDNIQGLATNYEKKVIITLHRRENHAIIEEWFKEIETLAEQNPDYEFIFPAHPNPNIQKHLNIFKNVKVVEPLKHKEFIEILRNCSCVITDSGGVQEESCFLGKCVLLCRKHSESERKDFNTTNIHSPKHLHYMFNNVKNGFKLYKNNLCPYGDGNSSEKIYNILKPIFDKKGKENE